MRIGNSSGARFGDGSSRHKANEIPDVLLLTAGLFAILGQTSFDVLVDDEMDDGLGDAKVGGRDAAVEASDAFLLVDFLDTRGDIIVRSVGGQ